VTHQGLRAQCLEGASSRARPRHRAGCQPVRLCAASCASISQRTWHSGNAILMKLPSIKQSKSEPLWSGAMGAKYVAEITIRCIFSMPIFMWQQSLNCMQYLTDFSLGERILQICPTAQQEIRPVCPCHTGQRAVVLRDEAACCSLMLRSQPLARGSVVVAWVKRLQPDTWAFHGPASVHTL
jgi:hypothetical protein